MKYFALTVTGFEESVAAKYYPRGVNGSIVVDPKIQFGTPVIEGTRIDVNSIYQMYKGGDSVDFLANLYSISIESAQASIDYFESAA